MCAGAFGGGLPSRSRDCSNFGSLQRASRSSADDPIELPLSIHAVAQSSNQPASLLTSHTIRTTLPMKTPWQPEHGSNLSRQHHWKSSSETQGLLVCLLVRDRTKRHMPYVRRRPQCCPVPRRCSPAVHARTGVANSGVLAARRTGARLGICIARIRPQPTLRLQTIDHVF